MSQMIHAGPAMYTIGCYCWSDIIGHTTGGNLPNAIAIVVSIVIFLLPYRSLVKKVFDEKP